MANSPVFKVYTADGEYVASFKYPEDAAALVTMRGKGTTIRYQHGVVLYTESVETPADLSYDAVATQVYNNLQAYQQKKYDERFGKARP